MSDIWILVIAASLATYAWRGLGVFLSGRMNVEGELFNWIACVAFAMVAGLVSRILLMPTGMLAQTVLVDRVVACVIGLIVYRLTNRNLLVAIASGVAVILVGVAVRAA